MKFTIFVTEKCNLRCKYCYEQGMDRTRNMDINVANKTIDFICRKIQNEKIDIPLYIILHGGEPFMNFELIKYIHKEISKRVKKRKVIYHLTTNGTILDDEKIDFICKNIDNISVSIDGTKKSHDQNRIFSNGTGTYDIVIKNAKKLLNSGKNVRVRMTYNINTVSELYESIVELSKNGFTDIVPEVDYMSLDWEETHIDILNDQISMIMNLKKEYPNLDISLLDVKNLNTRRGYCFGGITGFSIDIDGNLFPCTICVGNDELKIGNVFDENINEIKINKLFDINTSQNAECVGCSRQEFCSSTRCKIINKIVMGDFNKPVPIMCSLQKVSILTTKKLRVQREKSVS